MFNYSRKMAFINFIEAEYKRENEDSKINIRDNTTRAIATLLDRVASDEYVAKKDIAEFSESEYKALLIKHLSKYTLGTAQVYMSYLRRYFDWCISNGHIVTVPYKKITYKSLNEDDTIFSSSTIRTTIMPNPLGMKIALDEVFPNALKGEIDIVYKAFCWLVYFGLNYDEISTLKESDIDLNRMMIITSQQNNYRIYAESVEDIRRVIKVDSFNVVIKKTNNIVCKKRPDGDLVLRTTRGRVPSAKVAQTIVAERIGLSKSYSFTMRHIALAGLYYRVLEQESIRGELNIKQLLLRPFISKQHKPTERINNENLSRIKNDYDRWKLTYYSVN